MTSVCDNCAIRLFNTKGYCLSGIGEPYSGNAVILPNVDYSAYKASDVSFSKQIEIISNILFTGGFTKPNLFYLPLIRCNETISCDINDFVFKRCLTYLIADIKTYKFKNYLVIGKAVNRLFPDTSIYYARNSIYRNNIGSFAFTYSPFNKDKCEEFQYDVIRWYSAIINNNYSNYNTMT